jgi:tetratricopeptide (TPR) repeat protein
MMRTVFAMLALPALLAAPHVQAEDPCAAATVTSAAAQAKSLVGQKKYADAQGPARQALGSCPTQADAVAALGESLVALKQNDAALTAMNEALAKKADLAYAYLWRGYAYYNKKQPDRMVSDFETFLRLAPAAPEAAAVKQLLASIKR